MFAVKWIGMREVTRVNSRKDDLLDAFEILEDLFRDLFAPPEKRPDHGDGEDEHRSKRPRSHLKQRGLSVENQQKKRKRNN